VEGEEGPRGGELHLAEIISSFKARTLNSSLPPYIEETVRVAKGEETGREGTVPIASIREGKRRASGKFKPPSFRGTRWGGSWGDLLTAVSW